MNPFVQPLKPAYFDDVEKQLRRIFWEILFAPLLSIVEAATAQRIILNAQDDPLRDAMQSGRVQYSNGIFSGEFSAAISKALRRLGASFDPRSKIYRLDPARVPGWIMTEATSYARKAKSTHEELMRVLNETQSRLESLVPAHPVNAGRSIETIDRNFEAAARQLEIAPRLSDQAKAELKREYTKNMEIWITDFSQKEIQALRERVELNALQGYRFDRLITSIKNRFSVTENKAAFLARQETSLFLAKFREKRFADAGVRRYRWSTAHDTRVRHDHRHLNGEVFSYDQPPIVDQTTGRRGNPGQDYNCRCVDIPVLDGLDR